MYSAALLSTLEVYIFYTLKGTYCNESLRQVKAAEAYSYVFTDITCPKGSQICHALKGIVKKD